MTRLSLLLAALLLATACRGEEPTAQPEAERVPELGAAERARLAEQLEGEWLLLLTEQEQQQRRDALAHVERLGDTPHAREMRAALEESAHNGMTVTASTITLRLIRREVQLSWTEVQDDPERFSIETLDADGLRQTFDVSFDGPDRVTLAGRAGPVSRFERIP